MNHHQTKISNSTKNADAEFAPRFDQADSPALLTSSLRPLSIGDTYAGATAFLLCSGPSICSMDLNKLNKRGVLTCSVNNAGTLFRSNVWVCVDDPGNFSDIIWKDPAILKFLPFGRLTKKIRTRNQSGELVETEFSAFQMPNTFGYRSNSEFSPENWLSESTIKCGQTGRFADDLGIIGSRSVMLVAIKLLYYLGVRRVFLLGCDFRMKYGDQNYAFEQHRTRRSVRGNNRTYRALNARLQELKPYFDDVGFHVFNCTPNSGLAVFEYVDFEEAVALATSSMPASSITAGMYDKWHEESESSENNG